MIFNFGIGMPREIEIFQQIIKPRLFLPGHALAAGDGIDHVLVEEIGDRDPGDRADRRVGQRRDEVARGPHQIVIDRSVAVDHHLRDQRAGIDQHVDQHEQSSEQHRRTEFVRCDMRVETVGGHVASR
jgi:hypothetical protein